MRFYTTLILSGVFFQISELHQQYAFLASDIDHVQVGGQPVFSNKNHMGHEKNSS